ncbi:MAG: hypothetical protein KJ634_00140 [Gammaproteobacteria bacterium]|nr:hypothetical protein [Gammaproteobacteria bacterium]MBU1414007.1 hypothetical protein [Gammaproteobacteria bacterium]
MTLPEASAVIEAHISPQNGAPGWGGWRPINIAGQGDSTTWLAKFWTTQFSQVNVQLETGHNRTGGGKGVIRVQAMVPDILQDFPGATWTSLRGQLITKYGAPYSATKLPDANGEFIVWGKCSTTEFVSPRFAGSGICLSALAIEQTNWPEKRKHTSVSLTLGMAE